MAISNATRLSDFGSGGNLDGGTGGGTLTAGGAVIDFGQNWI